MYIDIYIDIYIYGLCYMQNLHGHVACTAIVLITLKQQLRTA